MDGIKFVDTTIRDGHQSLWAENMTTGMMLPVAKRMDEAGFEGDIVWSIPEPQIKLAANESMAFDFDPFAVAVP